MINPGDITEILTLYFLKSKKILSAKLFLRTINSIDDNVRVSKRVDVPGRLLRGFESGKIGPKDGSQFIGGNYASSLNLSSTVPNIFFVAGTILWTWSIFARSVFTKSTFIPVSFVMDWE